MSYPLIVETLREFGLITDEQAEEAQARFEVEWDKGWDDSNWWFSLADIAWHNEASWWTKFKWAGVPSMSWKVEWIRERRGW